MYFKWLLWQVEVCDSSGGYYGDRLFGKVMMSTWSDEMSRGGVKLRVYGGGGVEDGGKAAEKL